MLPGLIWEFGSLTVFLFDRGGLYWFPVSLVALQFLCRCPSFPHFQWAPFSSSLFRSPSTLLLLMSSVVVLGVAASPLRALPGQLALDLVYRLHLLGENSLLKQTLV